MLVDTEIRHFAADWINSWNAHDLDRIMAHYADEVVLVSPVASRILNDPTGTVRGRDALRSYFQRGLAVYPDLRFTLHDTLWGLSSLVLYYTNQKSSKTAEFMELNDHGLVVRVVANYNG